MAVTLCAGVVAETRGWGRRGGRWYEEGDGTGRDSRGVGEESRMEEKNPRARPTAQLFLVPALDHQPLTTYRAAWYTNKQHIHPPTLIHYTRHPSTQPPTHDDDEASK